MNIIVVERKNTQKILIDDPVENIHKIAKDLTNKVINAVIQQLFNNNTNDITDSAIDDTQGWDCTDDFNLDIPDKKTKLNFIN